MVWGGRWEAGELRLVWRVWVDGDGWGPVGGVCGAPWRAFRSGGSSQMHESTHEEMRARLRALRLGLGGGVGAVRAVEVDVGVVDDVVGCDEGGGDVAYDVTGDEGKDVVTGDVTGRGDDDADDV